MRAAIVIAIVWAALPARAQPAASGIPIALDRHGLLATDRAELEDTLAVGLRLDFLYARAPLHFGGKSPEDNFLDVRASVALGLYKKWLQLGVSLPFGDLRAYLKVRLLRHRLVGLALVLGGIFPTGDAQRWRSDDRYAGEPKLILDLRWKWLSVVLNLGARLHFPYDINFDGMKVISVGPEITYALGLGFAVHKKWTLAVETAGSEAFPTGAQQRTNSLLGSVFFTPIPSLSMYLGIGGSPARDAVRSEDFRIMTGVSWGSPPGIVAEATPSAPVESGIPVVSTADRDNDGVPDVRDRCPDQAEDRDGFDDGDGCPDEDDDGDGIADAQDRCPREPETKNNIDDEDGCPDTGGFTATPFAAPAPLLYDKGWTTPKDMSAPDVLDHLADSLHAHPEIKRLRIEGHAFEEPRAQALSYKRAEHLRDYLIGRGIDAKRVQAVGYGDARPVDKSAEKNRRVEFVVVE